MMVSTRSALLVCSMLAAACVARPARFADADPVLAASDRKSVTEPAPTRWPDAARYADAYVRRTATEALEPRRWPRGVDVNALDEVVASTWFAPSRPPSLDGYERWGAPVPPFTLAHDAPSPWEGAQPAHDARGRPYVLVRCRDEHARWQAAAGVVASRIFHALGYLTPEIHAVDDPSRPGVPLLAIAHAAPFGERRARDVGPTRASETRADDPNDRLPHEDRRSLRVLGEVAAWLALDDLREPALRDVYFGEPGAGHVQHLVVGVWDALALGAARSIDTDADRLPSNAWVALGTFGLAEKDVALPPAMSLESLFVPYVDATRGPLRVPFAAARRVRADDRFWMARRIAAIPASELERAVAAAPLDPAQRRHVVGTLLARRGAVLARAFDDRVTPLALEVPRPGSSARPLVLRLADQAIAAGLATAESSRYRVGLFDTEGAPLPEAAVLTPALGGLEIGVPPAALARGYVVVEVRAVRFGEPADRPMQIHVVTSAGVARVRGVLR